jgi:hypothetical protein
MIFDVRYCPNAIKPITAKAETGTRFRGLC